MKTINLFNKNLEYKDYDCSKNPDFYDNRPPLFNLYIQITDVCNAKCQFCDKANCESKDVKLDVNKLTSILNELSTGNILGRISLTGGEPLLKTDKLNQVLDIIYGINPNAYICLNTNGSKLENFENIKNQGFIKEIDISRHHYDESKNNNVFGVQVADLKKISDFSKKHNHLNLKLNCVMTKNLINSTSDIEKYLETISQYNIKEVRFISLLDLTEDYKNLYFDVNPLIEYFNSYTNIGNLYDKDICQCFGFIYVGSKGFPVTAFIRNTKKAKSNYMRQLVYTPDNYFLNGFGGQAIL